MIATSTVAAARCAPSPRRSLRMVQRNLLVYKHTWMVIVSGFFEPLFYLLGIGIGLGSMVPPIDGISYSAFVAPGLLASSCLNGAITDGFFNIFFKLHYQKTYDGILATPMRVPDVAFGEMLWALGRGSLYAAVFLVVLLALGEAIGAPDAALAVGAAGMAGRGARGRIVFGHGDLPDHVRAQGAGLRHGDGAARDADVSVQRHLRSGDQFPEPVQWIVRVTPLYHAVGLLRQLTTGNVSAGIMGHLAYLVVAGIAAFCVAMYRLERTLIK